MSEVEERDVGRNVGWIRLGVGCAQGLAAWLLIREVQRGSAPHWPIPFAASVMLTAYPPLIILAGVGRMRPAALAIWTAAAAALVAALGAYDVWREPVQVGEAARVWPSVQLLFFGAAALYIAHHLVEPADLERSWRPSYRSRFETAWRHGFQLAVSLVFTGVFWAVLQLGAALFGMIGVSAFGQLLRQTWFVSPATAMAFAGAVHLTDVRPALIRGVREVVLTLLAWLLPLMAALAAAFLIALLFTGVQPLWATRRASGLLLSAAAMLVILINAAYQDGQAREGLPLALRWSARGAGVLLVPLVLLAAWATGLRVAQYGLTPERIVSVAALVAAAVYAAGYVWAGVSKGPWMRRLEQVNVAAALVEIVLILLLLSPLADPARLAVDDQMGRLGAHRTPVERFDFRFLRFHAARFGREALDRLARSRDPAIAAAAKNAQAMSSPYGEQGTAGPPLSGAVVHPAGAALPDSFRRQVFERAETGGALCLLGRDPCDLYLLDVTGDGSPEVLVAHGEVLQAFAPDPGGRWGMVGTYRVPTCGRDRAQTRKRVLEALDRGQARLAPPRAQSLQAGDGRLDFVPLDRCTHVESVRVDPLRLTPPPQGLGPAFHRR